MTGIILSGGKSTRMGRDKAFIEIEGVPIIQRIYDLFKNIFDEIIIVANHQAPYAAFSAKVVSDLVVDRGALGGLYTGLFYSSYPYSFCVASDMPFLKESLIQYFIRQTDGYDVVVPRTEDGLQPLHAVYSKNCIQPMKHIMDAGQYKIIDIYPLVRTKVVEEPEFIRLDPTKESFININTPEELSVLYREKQNTPCDA